MDFFNDYIVVIVSAICLCVGYVLKNLVPSEKINRFIPLIMAALGIAINVWVNNFSFTPEIVLGGMVSGLASTGMYEVAKQIKEK